MDIKTELYASWDVFESCHDNDDTKCIAGFTGKNSLYDVRTVGNIFPRSPVFRCPEVCVIQSENDIAISVEETVTIISHEAASHKATINLGSRIDALCFRPDGGMIIVADSSGVIHLISVHTGKVIFSHKVVDPASIQKIAKNNSEKEQKLFCSVTCSKDYEESCDTFFIGVGFTHSKFIVFSNVKLLLLEKDYEADNVDALRSTMMEMNTMEYDASAIHGATMRNLVSISNGFCQKYITTGKGVIALWTDNRNLHLMEQSLPGFVLESCADLPCFGVGEIVKLFHLYQHLYSLDSKGTICQWHVNSLVLMRIWENSTIQDFTVTDSGVADGKLSPKLYAIVTDEATKELKMCIFQLPSMVPSFTYSCGRPSFCRLCLGPSSLVDIVYVDGDISDSAPCVRIHHVSEAAPEDRLLRLLSKRRFDQAEEFAVFYNLDTQRVYEQKATFLANAIVESNDGDKCFLKDLFKELMSCLHKVNDETIIADICMDTVISDVHMNYSLLALGRSRLGNALHSDGNHLGEVKNDLLLQIINRMDRLVTFRIAHGYSQDDGSEWVRFCDVELPEELIRLLANGNIPATATLLLRHKASLLTSLESTGQTSDDTSCTEKHLEALLEHIPRTIDVNVLAEWLEDSLLPTLLPRIPCALKVLAVWLRNRAESYEDSSSSDWPENGLRMANVIFNFQNNISGLGIVENQFCAASQVFKSTSVEVAKLRLLASRLQLLLQLKRKYKCNVSLTEFIEETTMTLTYRMLDRVVVPDLIPMVLKNTIRPYMNEHGLSEEEVLLGYVEDLLSRFCNLSQSTLESLRERKIVAILQCVTESQVFLEAIVKLAKRASVPWSEDVDLLVDKGIRIVETSNMQEGSGDAQTSRELLAKRQASLKDLQYCRHIAQLPTILAEYGLVNVKLGNTASHQQLIRFLIRQGTKEALDQAHHFCQTFTTVSSIDFYRFRLVHLLNNGKEHEIMELLMEVESRDCQLAISLVECAIRFAEIKLGDADCCNKERGKYCNAACIMIEHVICKHVYCDPRRNFLLFHFEEKLSLLKSVMELQVQCGECVSIEEYSDKNFCQSLLARKIEQYIFSNKALVHCDAAKAESSSSSGGALKTYETIFFEHENTTNSSKMSDGIPQDSAMEQGKNSVPVSLSHVLNLARILRVPTDQIKCRMALVAAKNGKSGILIATNLCSETLRISPTEASADAVLEIVVECIKNTSATTSNEVMKLASKVLGAAAEAVMFCKPEKMAEGIVLCKFYTLCNELIRVTDNHKEIFTQKGALASKDPYCNAATLFPSMEDSGGLMLQTEQVLPIFMKIIKLLFINGSNIINPTTTRNLEDIEFYLMELRKLAFQMTSVLQEARHPQHALSWSISCISITLRSMANCCNSLAMDKEGQEKRDSIYNKMLTLIEELNKIMPDYVNDFIKKVLCARIVDVNLAIGLLTLLQITGAQKLLQSEISKAGNNPKRIMCIAQAGIATLLLHSMDKEVEKYRYIFMDARWGELFQPLKIPFDQFYSATQISKTSTLKKLIHHPEASGKMIWEFCIDYDLDATSSLLEFVRVLLSDPSCLVTDKDRKFSESALVSVDSPKIPIFGMQSMAWGDKDAKTKDAGENLQEKEPDFSRPSYCVQKEMDFVMSKVSEKKELCRQLVRILRLETSPYYYKRAEFLLNLIEKCGHVQSDVNVKMGLKLIECLELFNRSSAVSDYESQNWSMGNISATCKLPEISNQRLPLHPLLFGDSSSAWKILVQELDEKSATRLVPIARILSLNIDKLFVTAADNCIRARMNDKGVNRLALSDWQFETIRTLAHQVKDLRMAIALAKKVAELLPISEQKVKAYKWCTDLAGKWRASVSAEEHEQGSVVNTHRNLRSHFFRVSVELVLHQHKLLTDTTSALTSSPEKLILLLYQHPSIVQQYLKPDPESYPDILEATTAIADVYSLNIFKLRKCISMDWLLNSGNKEQDDDEDLTVNLQNMQAASIINPNLESASVTNTDKIRLLYILSHLPPTQAAKFILGFAFDRENPHITDGCRVRALQCALQLFDDGLIKELTNKTVSYIRETLRILVYLTQFESIGFVISGAQLKGGKKDEIARSIYAMPKFRHDPRAMRLAAELCREFGSWCPKTWQALLQQLIALRQISYLRQLLPDICCHASISSLPCLATVWQSCVTFPLAAMTPPLKTDDVKVAISSYHFLLSCPVLLQINLMNIAQNFCCIELPLLALGCLLVDPSQDANSRKLAIANYDAIQEQQMEYSSVLGHKQITEVLRTCKSTKENEPDR